MKKLLAIFTALISVSAGFAAITTSYGTITWNSGASLTRDATMSGYYDTSDVFTFPNQEGQMTVTFHISTAGFDAADGDSVYLRLMGLTPNPTATYKLCDSIIKHATAAADGADDSSASVIPFTRIYFDTCWNYYKYNTVYRLDSTGTLTLETADTFRQSISIGGNGWATKFRGYVLMVECYGDTLDDTIKVFYKMECRTGEDRIPTIGVGGASSSAIDWNEAEFLAYLGHEAATNIAVRFREDALRA